MFASKPALADIQLAIWCARSLTDEGGTRASAPALKSTKATLTQVRNANRL